MVTASRGGCQVTQNVSWFQRVEPREDNSGAELAEESGEELNGGCILRPIPPYECQQGSDSGSSRDHEGTRSTDPGPVRGLEPSGRSERYNLRRNPNPSQRLRDFMC
ncbi:hypothetical protein NDU88_003948 [Pleurodeles waltl]|uniref:Uncharacterized protein n=1 Tax=Pleurodeles waltl TaxID=8319 RepID=A0AAV7W3K3_PLEWA|nr:hypothetical protein NDU88_003948 [Pleurodeles waltl]